MRLTLSDLGQVALLTFREPRRGMRALIEADPPQVARLIALVLMAVVAALLVHLGLKVAPLPDDENIAVQALLGSPFRTALVQLVVQQVTVFLIHFVGKARGGSGRLADALLAVVWLQALMVLLQGVQLLLLVVLPPLAVAASYIAPPLFFWYISSFTAEVHQFRSVGRVFVGVVLTLLLLSFVLTFILLTLFGPEAFANV